MRFLWAVRMYGPWETSGISSCKEDKLCGGFRNHLASYRKSDICHFNCLCHAIKAKREVKQAPSQHLLTAHFFMLSKHHPKLYLNSFRARQEIMCSKRNVWSYNTRTGRRRLLLVLTYCPHLQAASSLIPPLVLEPILWDTEDKQEYPTSKHELLSLPGNFHQQTDIGGLGKPIRLCNWLPFFIHIDSF